MDNTTYIVSFSGGLGSFMAAKLVIDEVGKDRVKLVFTDTKTEDEDLYRFIRETAKFLDVPLITLADGRNIWEVFESVRFMGNSRIDPCSRVLKRELFRKWVEQQYPTQDVTIVFGIGKQESHRMEAITERWKPYKTVAPLCASWKTWTHDDIVEILLDAGIEPPRLYEFGFPHNNCGGFCVKTGQKQMKLLLEKMPERYRWHEEQQEKLFALIGKRRGFIRRVVNGEMHYLGLKEFREMLERGEQCEMYEEKGCGCFV